MRKIDRRTLCVQTVVRMHGKDTVKFFPLAREEGMGAREDAVLAETPLPTAEGGWLSVARGVSLGGAALAMRD